MSYDILESDFSKRLSSAYQLSILVGMDSLVYFAFDTNTNHALLLRAIPYAHRPGTEGFNLPAELKSIFAREDVLGHLFRRVKIIIPDVQPVLVPNRLYNEAEKTTYYEEVMAEVKPENILNDEVDELGIQVLYPADQALQAALKKQFPTAKFYNGTTPFLLGCRKTADESSHHNLFAHFTNTRLHLALFEKKSLLFSNAFEYTTSGDVLYFVLLTCNQFGIDPAQLPLNLSGYLLNNAEIYKTLYRYVQELRFVPYPNFLHFSRKFNDVPSHFFFDLYSLALCK